MFGKHLFDNIHMRLVAAADGLDRHDDSWLLRRNSCWRMFGKHLFDNIHMRLVAAADSLDRHDDSWLLRRMFGRHLVDISINFRVFIRRTRRLTNIRLKILAKWQDLPLLIGQISNSAFRATLLCFNVTAAVGLIC